MIFLAVVVGVGLIFFLRRRGKRINARYMGEAMRAIPGRLPRRGFISWRRRGYWRL